MSVPSYTYDPSKILKATDLRAELAAIIEPYQWGTHPGKCSSPMTPTGQLKGLMTNVIPPSLDLVIMLAREAHASIRRGVPGVKCRLYSDALYHQAIMYANKHGGGRMAIGKLHAHKVSFHSTNHDFNIARTEDDGWWLIDTAFASNPDLARWLVRISPADDRFWGLEM
jgi:hypothetical protein